MALFNFKLIESGRCSVYIDEAIAGNLMEYNEIPKANVGAELSYELLDAHIIAPDNITITSEDYDINDKSIPTNYSDLTFTVSDMDENRVVAVQVGNRAFILNSNDDNEYSLPADLITGDVEISVELKGNVSGNGVINISDAQLVYEIFCSINGSGFIPEYTVTPLMKALSDVNGDDILDVSDARAIAYYIHKGIWESSANE